MAQSVIGSLRVNLGIDSANFTKGLRESQSRLSKFGAVARTAALAIAGAAAAAGAGMAIAVKGAINTADEMTKAAQKIGLSTEELSKLKYAADLSDVSLDKLQTGVGRLSQNMADAAMGVGEGAEAFEALGISVKNADGTLRPTTDVLNDISDRFAAMPDGAQKTALAMDLMGRSGRDMIPLLNGGSAALREMGDEAQRAGLVISTETGKAAERFNDSLTRLKGAAQGLVLKLTAALAPALAQISEGTVVLVQNLGNLRTIAAEVFDRLGIVMEAAGYYAESVAARIESAFLGAFDGIVSGAVQGFNSLIGVFEGVANRLIDTLKRLPGADKLAETYSFAPVSLGRVDAPDLGLRGRAGLASELADASKNLGDFAMAEALKPLESIIPAAGAASAAIKDFGAAVVDADDKAGGGKGAKSLSDTLEELKRRAERVFAETRTPLEEFQMKMAELNELVKVGAIDWDTYHRAVKQAQDDLRDAGKEGENAFDRLDDSFADAVTSILQGTQSIRGAFSQLLASIGGGIVSDAVGGIFKSAFAGFKIPGFARGTNFAPGGLALVGERGPELVNMPRGSQVIPNHELGGGGMTLNYNPNVVIGAGADKAEVARGFAVLRADVESIKASFRDNVASSNNDFRFRGAV